MNDWTGCLFCPRFCKSHKSILDDTNFVNIMAENDKDVAKICIQPPENKIPPDPVGVPYGHSENTYNVAGFNLLLKLITDSSEIGLVCLPFYQRVGKVAQGVSCLACICLRSVQYGASNFCFSAYAPNKSAGCIDNNLWIDVDSTVIGPMQTFIASYIGGQDICMRKRDKAGCPQNGFWKVILVLAEYATNQSKESVN